MWVGWGGRGKTTAPRLPGRGDEGGPFGGARARVVVGGGGRGKTTAPRLPGRRDEGDPFGGEGQGGGGGWGYNGPTADSVLGHPGHLK